VMLAAKLAKKAERSVAFQFRRLSEIANGNRPAEIRKLSTLQQPAPASPADVTQVQVAVPPYSSGMPYPEYLFDTTTGTVRPTRIPPDVNFWECGDAIRGRISIATSVGRNEYGLLYPLIWTWLGGDATTQR
jgi:hypothetical protein